MAENKAKTGFQKGRSGNPGGRPKLPAGVKEAYREMHPRALARLNQLVDSDDEKVALRACEIVCERVEGKVPQALNLDGSVSIRVVNPYAEDTKGVGHADRPDKPGGPSEVATPAGAVADPE